MGGQGSGISRKRTMVPRRSRPRWLKRMDQRSAVARAMHERLATIGDDLGGLDQMSGIQRSILERFIHTEALAAEVEKAVRDGEPFDCGKYLAITDRVLRLGQTLGLNRKAKRVPSLAELVQEDGPQ